MSQTEATSAVVVVLATPKTNQFGGRFNSAGGTLRNLLALCPSGDLDCCFDRWSTISE